MKRKRNDEKEKNDEKNGMFTKDNLDCFLQHLVNHPCVKILKPNK